jgi:hypothetical protein
LASRAALADLPGSEDWSMLADLTVACGIERFSDLHARFGAVIATRARDGERELLMVDVL